MIPISDTARQRNSSIRIPTLCLCVLLLETRLGRADDWPGLLGKHRDGHSASTRELPTNPPASLLTPKWKLDAGQGYAGAAVADGKAVLYDRDGDQDRIRYVDAFQGTLIWERKMPARYRGGVDSDKGPRCVPSIAQNAVVVYSTAGDLSVLSTVDGSVRWTRSLTKEFDADDGYFGNGSSPLILEDRVVVNVGGKKAGVLCVSLAEGKDLWNATNYDASYASPILMNYGVSTSNSQNATVVIPTRLKTIGVDAQTGKVLWETAFGQRGPTVNAATPIVCKPGELFLTASYGIGNVLLRISPTSVETLYQGDQINSQYATPVYSNGFVYGSDGREDMGSASYKCLNPATGEVAWTRDSMPICHTIAIGETQLLLIGIDGRVWLLDTNAQQFSVIWETKLTPNLYRAIPALANDLLFVRSNGSNPVWQALELRRLSGQ